MLPDLLRAVSGWRLTAAVSAALVLMALALLAAHAFDVAGVRAVIRATGQSSMVLFCLAFSASALARLFPTAWTRWQRQNRRYLGLSFAASHTVHAAAIVGFALTAPAQFHAATSTASFVFGGIAYAFIVAMTLTSFDRAAAWLGARNWRILHTVGAYDIWLTFLLSEGMRALRGGSYYWLATALLLAVMGLRLTAYAMRAPRPQAARLLVNQELPEGSFSKSGIRRESGLQHCRANSSNCCRSVTV
jgi:DMSO/TMAO reductase YedYZ heme-binding membrane subunit